MLVAYIALVPGTLFLAMLKLNNNNNNRITVTLQTH